MKLAHVGWIILACCCRAAAYEAEPAVPLTLAGETDKVAIESIAIQLHGRDVEISTQLSNRTKSKQVLAFYASTPLFSYLGIAEEHFDKTFSDLSVRVGDHARKVTTLRRAYLMGRDITDALIKAGIDPLPDLNASTSKLARVPAFRHADVDMWKGAVIHSWNDTMAPQTSAIHRVRYRALPQFGLEQLASDSLARRIRQHCGDPEAIRQRFGKDEEYVIAERYELPVQYMALREVTVEVTQPARNWIGAHPVVALACGVSGQGTQLNGRIDSAELSLDVLLISSLPTEK